MADYSNRTIVALLAVALVITVVGTVISVGKLNELGGTYNKLTYLTGAAVDTSTGQTNITITSTTSITLANTSMNFGSGRVNASCDICVMDSNNTFLNYYANGSVTGGGVGEDRNCCVGFNRVTAGFLIENTGNQNVSVGYTCSGNCTFQSFIGGSFGPSVTTISGVAFVMHSQLTRVQLGEQGSTDSVAASCAGGGSLYKSVGWNATNYSGTNSTFDSAEGTRIKLSPTGHWLCGNYTNSPLDYSNGFDAAVMDINLSVPSNAPASGVQSRFVLTFNGTSQ